MLPLVRSDDPPRWFRWLVRLAVVTPIIVAVVRALATGWYPVGDSAMLAVRAYDVGTPHHPLLGSWTSASLTIGTDVNNPGPLYQDLLAPFMWTFGRWFGIGVGTAIGVGSLNVLTTLGIGRIGGLLGGWRVERWTLLGAAALAWAMGSELLIDIWQPHALLLPFLALLFLTVAVMDGHWRWLPWWAGVASLVVQTHIGYVYLLAILGMTIGVAGTVAARNAQFGPRALFTHRTTGLTLLVLSVAWLQSAIEQVFGAGQGNLARLATNAGGNELTVGPAAATQLIAQVVGVPPWWTRFGFDDTVESTALSETEAGQVLVLDGVPNRGVALLLVALLVGAVVAVLLLVRKRDVDGPVRSVLNVALVVLLGSWFALSIQTLSVVGLGAHHVRWLFVVSLFVQLALFWGAVEAGLIPQLTRAVGPVLLAVTASLLSMNLQFHAQELGPTVDRLATDTLDRTFDDLEGFSPQGPVVYDLSNGRIFEPWSGAVKMRLRELGIEFRVVDDGLVRQFGNRRAARGDEAVTLRQFERGAALVYDGPGCVVTIASPVPANEEQAVDAIIRTAVDDFVDGSVHIDADGLPSSVAALVNRALAGHEHDAYLVVADGVAATLAAEGRLLTSTPAVDQAIAQRERIDRRVVGTLALVAEPPRACDESE